MTESYANQKAREALEATGGNKHDAQKLLITWAVRDVQLLLALAKPHLKGIAAAVIDHVARTKPSGRIVDDGPDSLSRSAIDDILAGGSVKLPADKRKKGHLPPPKSTERQASTMRKLAAAFTKKKREE